MRKRENKGMIRETNENERKEEEGERGTMKRVKGMRKRESKE